MIFTAEFGPWTLVANPTENRKQGIYDERIILEENGPKQGIFFQLKYYLKILGYRLCFDKNAQ